MRVDVGRVLVESGISKYLKSEFKPPKYKGLFVFGNNDGLMSKY